MSNWEKSKVSALMYIDLMQGEPEVEVIESLIISGDDLQQQLEQKDELVTLYAKNIESLQDNFNATTRRNEKLERVVEAEKEYREYSEPNLEVENELYRNIEEALNQLDDDQRIKESCDE